MSNYLKHKKLMLHVLLWAVLPHAAILAGMALMSFVAMENLFNFDVVEWTVGARASYVAWILSASILGIQRWYAK